MNDISSVVGFAFILGICIWGVWFLIVHLRSNVESGSAVDRTLDEIDKEDAPGMFWLQVAGFVMAIGATAIIAIGALVALAVLLMGGGR